MQKILLIVFFGSLSANVWAQTDLDSMATYQHWRYYSRAEKDCISDFLTAPIDSFQVYEHRSACFHTSTTVITYKKQENYFIGEAKTTESNKRTFINKIEANEVNEIFSLLNETADKTPSIRDFGITENDIDTAAQHLVKLDGYRRKLWNDSSDTLTRFSLNDHKKRIAAFLDTISTQYIQAVTAKSELGCTVSVDFSLTVWNSARQQLLFETTYDPCTGDQVTPYLFPTILLHNKKRAAIRSLPFAYFIKKCLVKNEMTDVCNNERLLRQIVVF